MRHGHEEGDKGLVLKREWVARLEARGEDKRSLKLGDTKRIGRQSEF